VGEVYQVEEDGLEEGVLEDLEGVVLEEEF
jgi:hypothetical protein